MKHMTIPQYLAGPGNENTKHIIKHHDWSAIKWEWSEVGYDAHGIPSPIIPQCVREALRRSAAAAGVVLPRVFPFEME